MDESHAKRQARAKGLIAPGAGRPAKMTAKRKVKCESRKNRRERERERRANKEPRDARKR